MTRRPLRLSSLFLAAMVVASVVAVVLSGALWIAGDLAGFRSTAGEIRTRWESFTRERLVREVDRAITYIEFRTASLEDQLRDTLRSRVDRAHASAENLYASLRADGAGHDRAVAAVVEMLRPIRYDDGRGYLFAVTLDGRQLLYPTEPRFEGSSVLDVRDARGSYVVRDELALVTRHGQGFATGFWRKPDGGSEMTFPKITFVKGLPEVGIYLGTGEYLDDFAADVRTSTLERLARIRFGDDEGLFVLDAATRLCRLADGRTQAVPFADSALASPDEPDLAARIAAGASQPGGGFVSSTRVRTGGAPPVLQLTYVKPYPEWDWIIGASIDLDAVEPTITALESQLWRALGWRIAWVTAALAGVLILLVVGARTVTRTLRHSIATFVNFFGTAAGSVTEIPEETQRFEEFRELARAANRMIRDRQRMDADREQLQHRLAQSRKMEALGMLAGGVAHDLNNILSGLVSYPDLMLSELPADSPLRPPMETIRDSGRRAAAVVDDLVTVARSPASTLVAVHLNDHLRRFIGSAEAIQVQRDHPSVTFRLNLAPGVGTARCSPHHLDKTLLNLVINGAEACEREGLVVLSTSRRQLVDPLSGFEVVPSGEWCVVSVEDNGIGIEREELQRIFEPFVTRKVMGRSGSGLGLMVVWNSVKDQGGFIDVTSSAGGTRFDLYLPATREQVASAADDDLSAVHGAGESVLVVDDDPGQQEITVAMLARLGYDPAAVASGESAVAWVSDHPVDAVVLDMVMEPGISGRETYRRILEHRPGTPAVIASGYSASEEVAATLRMGASAVIRKPFSLVELGRALRSALAGRDDVGGGDR